MKLKDWTANLDCFFFFSPRRKKMALIDEQTLMSLFSGVPDIFHCEVEVDEQGKCHLLSSRGKSGYFLTKKESQCDDHGSEN